MAARFFDGHSERNSYRQFDGKSWYAGKAFAENYHRCSINLPFWLYDILHDGYACSSVLLLGFGNTSLYTFAIQLKFISQ